MSKTRSRLLTFTRDNVLFVVSSVVLSLVGFILFSVYINRLGAFGCFDDCNNIVRGYFLLKGRHLFSEVFNNHMPLMGYLSFVIQKVAQPSSIYHLLLFHRMSLLAYSAMFWVFLVWRFRWAGLGFVIFYELYNIYLFGDRFLAEGVIVYPLVYMAGVAWYKLSGKEVYKWEYLVVAFFVWVVMFMRAPYVPVAFFLYGVILWRREDIGVKAWSILIFLLLTSVFLVLHETNDFVFQVYTINKVNVSTHLYETGTNGFGMLKVLLYPLIVYFQGHWNIIRVIFITFVSALFMLVVPLVRAHEYLKLSILFVVLTLAALRFTEPGQTFYAAHHILNWYALLVMFVFLLLVDTKRKLQNIVMGILSIVFVFTFFSPHNVIWLRVDTDAEIHDGYAKYSLAGRIFQMLGDGDSRLFVDGGDDLIYWRSGLYPAYKYSWYTSLMPKHKPYRDARIEMFQKYPPDFYFGNCRADYYLPDFVADDYTNIRKLDGAKSCLYVKNDVLNTISDEQKSKLEGLGYVL